MNSISIRQTFSAFKSLNSGRVGSNSTQGSAFSSKRIVVPRRRIKYKMKKWYQA